MMFDEEDNCFIICYLGFCTNPPVMAPALKTITLFQFKYRNNLYPIYPANGTIHHFILFSPDNIT